MINVERITRDSEYKVLVAGTGITLLSELTVAIKTVRETISGSIGQKGADLLVQACIKTAMEKEI